MKSNILILLVIILFLPKLVSADTMNVVSCEQAVVQTAISSASDGDIIQVPSGECTWTSRILIDKEIAVIGAGIGSTIINDWGFEVSDGTDDWRISGFEWRNSNLGSGTDQFCIAFGGHHSSDGCRNYRIDNCKFVDYPRAIYGMGHTSGVIDNCVFIGGILTDSDGGIRFWGHNDQAWTEASGFGGSDFNFIEDCTFETNGYWFQHPALGGHGARYVFRHNTLTETGGEYGRFGSVDTHGYCEGSGVWGTRAFEIYENLWTRGTNRFGRAMQLRGGTGVIFNNTFDISLYTWDDYIYLRERRLFACGGTVASCPTGCNSNPYCETSEGGEGYPCCNQIGTGINRVSEPLYIWDNVDENNNPISGLVEVQSCASSYIVGGRDYFLDKKPGYVPYTYPHPLTYECGNNRTDPGEACDGTDVNGYDCTTVAAGFVSGQISCLSDCSGYDTSQCIPGNTITAASCSQDDVQTAIEKANNGDIIIVPTGNCYWDSSSCTHIGNFCAPVIINKSVLLYGENNPTIIDNTDSSWNKPALLIQSTTDRIPVRITGFTFSGNGGSEGTIMIRDGMQNFRIDNCRFTHSIGRGIITRQDSYGVIDKNTFFNTPNEHIEIMAGDSSWSDSIEEILGTPNAVYLENNIWTYNDTFTGNGANTIDANGGARFVYRHNLVDSYDNSQPLEAHGFCVFSSGGTRSYEIYNNTFNMETSAWNAFRFRGGGGVIYNNILNGDWGTNEIRLDNYRVHTVCDQVTPSTCTADPNNPGTWEEPDRPCTGQIHNLFVWDNEITDGLLNIGIDTSTPPEYIIEGRDFHRRAPSLTDDGFIYAPYIYPHPLTLIEPAPSQPTCQSTGFVCCSSCEPGTEQSAYDSDCPGVCCGTCEFTPYFLPNQIIEAEDGELEAPMTTGSDASASGGIYITSPSTDLGLVNFTFDIQSAGRYRMEASINSNNDGGQNSFFVGLDGEPVLGDSNYSYDFPLVSVFTWDDVSLRGSGGSAAEFDPMLWDLTTGLHNFTIYGREYNSWLDQINLRGPIHRSDTDLDVCVELSEMFAFMDRWKVSIVDVSMPEMMESIGLWKSGEGCS